MNKAVKEIFVMAVAGVISALVVEYLRDRMTLPPVIDDSSKNWWGF